MSKRPKYLSPPNQINKISEPDLIIALEEVNKKNLDIRRSFLHPNDAPKAMIYEEDIEKAGVEFEAELSKGIEVARNNGINLTKFKIEMPLQRMDFIPK